MLEEKVIFEKLELDKNSIIFVQMANVILKDQVEITRTTHRMSFSPADDLSNAPAEVIRMAELFWTPELVRAYKDALNELPTAQ
jgi:hypothetical protein